MTNDSSNTNSSKIKCVFLGDGAVGKTSLIVSYTTNGYPNEYVPTAIDTYDVVVHVDGEPVTFEMNDTPGQDDFDTLRPLVYPNTDVFLLCFSGNFKSRFLHEKFVKLKWILPSTVLTYAIWRFFSTFETYIFLFSVVSPSSFTNIREKWIPEIKKSGSKSVPLILVGTQSDLRNDVNTRVELAKYKESPISEAEAKKLCKDLNCESYIETSALTQHNLKEVFDEAIIYGLKGRKIKEKIAAKKAARQQGCNCVIL